MVDKFMILSDSRCQVCRCKVLGTTPMGFPET